MTKQKKKIVNTNDQLNKQKRKLEAVDEKLEKTKESLRDLFLPKLPANNSLKAFNERREHQIKVLKIALEKNCPTASQKTFEAIQAYSWSIENPTQIEIINLVSLQL